MIKYILIFLLAVGTACNAQITNQTKQTKGNNMNNPVVTKDFEKFDSVLFNNRKDKNDNVLRATQPDGSYLEMTVWDGGMGYSFTPRTSYYMLQKVYYKNNGNIKAKGLYFNNGFLQLGTWYEFDEQGRLVREVNYDKDYHLKLEDVLRFCEQEGIRVDRGPILQSTGYHTKIRRAGNTQGKTWTIEWLKQPEKVEKVILDDATGKVLNRTETNFTNN
ncbi:hypothetical protein [Chitinophaga varians]|uniref:hypothetical protein n=1 Tax=Chitinophaga varians TaxID=2202339 RepID=UPI00165EDE77|nr:hypothetical protein [Chitinophaga varians]MBC9914631.1 hypothetical protein [Chitinophaga varians]